MNSWADALPDRDDQPCMAGWFDQLHEIVDDGQDDELDGVQHEIAPADARLPDAVQHGEAADGLTDAVQLQEQLVPHDVDIHMHGMDLSGLNTTIPGRDWKLCLKAIMQRLSDRWTALAGQAVAWCQSPNLAETSSLSSIRDAAGDADTGAAHDQLVPFAPGHSELQIYRSASYSSHRPKWQAYALELALGLEQRAAVVATLPLCHVPWSQDHANTVRYYLGNDGRYKPLCQEAEDLGMSMRSCHRILQSTACSWMLMVRRDIVIFLRRLTTDIVASGGKALVYYDELRYDETPMVVRTADPAVEISPGAADSIVPQLAAMTRFQPIVKSSHTNKIVQTVRTVSALYKLCDNTYCLVRFPVPCWLQTVASGTAENYHRCIAQTSFTLPPDIVKSFHRVQRLVCVDGDAAIDRAERGVASQDPDLISIVLKCEMHMATKIGENTFAQVGDSIRAIRCIGLALNYMDGMRSFRTALCTVLTRMLVYRKDVGVSDQHIRHNTRLLDMFLPESSTMNRLRRLIILTLCNGDWSLRGQLVHCCNGGCCQSESDCLHKLQTLLVGAVAGFSPTTWPTSRQWVGSEDAVLFLGLLESINGLLSEAFLLWSGSETPATPAHGCHRINSSVHMITNVGHFLRDCSGPPGTDGKEDGGTNAQSDEKKDDKWDRRKKEQSINKFVGARWLSQGRSFVLGVLCMLRNVIGPIMNIVYGLFQISSATWREAQYRQWLKETVENSTEERGRCYSLLMAAENILESKCMDDVVAAMQQRAKWAAFPAASRTCAFRTRTFMMLSSVGCHCHELMVLHERYPFKIMKSLVDESCHHEVIHRDCVHMRGAWGNALVDEYGQSEQGLKDLSCQAEIMGTVTLGHRETIEVECSHASIRRALVQGSVQTHRVMLVNLSARRTCNQFRNWVKKKRAYKGFADDGDDDGVIIIIVVVIIIIIVIAIAIIITIIIFIIIVIIVIIMMLMMRMMVMTMMIVRMMMLMMMVMTMVMMMMIMQVEMQPVPRKAQRQTVPR